MFYVENILTDITAIMTAAIAVAVVIAYTWNGIIQITTTWWFWSFLSKSELPFDFIASALSFTICFSLKKATTVELLVMLNKNWQH